MNIEKWVVDPENFDGYAKTYLVNGKCPYYGKTEAEYLAEGYKVVSDDEYTAMVREYEKSLCGKWQEITEEEFEDMLNVLPPLRWYNGGFYMSERYTGSISGFYQKLNGKFYTSLQDIYSPREEVLDSLKSWIASHAEK